MPNLTKSKNIAEHDLETTVQAIRNIANFFVQKNCYEFARIRTNFVLKFVHEIRKKFAHKFVREFAHKFVYELMPEDYVFKEKIRGKVSVSLILPEIFQCRVLSSWADIEICWCHQRQYPIRNY